SLILEDPSVFICVHLWLIWFGVHLWLICSVVAGFVRSSDNVGPGVRSRPSRNGPSSSDRLCQRQCRPHHRHAASSWKPGTRNGRRSAGSTGNILPCKRSLGAGTPCEARSSNKQAYGGELLLKVACDAERTGGRRPADARPGPPGSRQRPGACARRPEI